jgi:hypothetical protein
LCKKYSESMFRDALLIASHLGLGDSGLFNLHASCAELHVGHTPRDATRMVAITAPCQCRSNCSRQRLIPEAIVVNSLPSPAIEIMNFDEHVLLWVLLGVVVAHFWKVRNVSTSASEVLLDHTSCHQHASCTRSFLGPAKMLESQVELMLESLVDIDDKKSSEKLKSTISVRCQSQP